LALGRLLKEAFEDGFLEMAWDKMALMRFFDMGQACVAAKLDIKHGVVQASRYYPFWLKPLFFVCSSTVPVWSTTGPS
jgi:hypothetical protein